MIKGRIPTEDLYAIESIVNNIEWKAILKYVNLMSKTIEQDLVDSRPDDNLLYLKGRVDGARQLNAMIKDFKDYIRKEYKDQV